MIENVPRRTYEVLLHNAIRLGFNEANPEGESVNLVVIAVEQKLERLGITGLRSIYQLCFRHFVVLYHSIFVVKTVL
jgi:hypothetical protein